MPSSSCITHFHTHFNQSFQCRSRALISAGETDGGKGLGVGGLGGGRGKVRVRVGDLAVASERGKGGRARLCSTAVQRGSTSKPPKLYNLAGGSQIQPRGEAQFTHNLNTIYRTTRLCRKCDNRPPLWSASASRPRFKRGDGGKGGKGGRGPM